MGPVPESIEDLFSQIPGLGDAISAEVPGPDSMPPGSPDQLQLTVRDWMVYHATTWASTAVDRVARNASPEEAVNLLREIADQADPGARNWLGAGTLENLLAYRGNEVILHVEEAARHSSGFREALCGVWQRGMPPEVWRRVCAARSESAT
jgi:hypothetical protein